MENDDNLDNLHKSHIEMVLSESVVSQLGQAPESILHLDRALLSPPLDSTHPQSEAVAGPPVPDDYFDKMRLLVYLASIDSEIFGVRVQHLHLV